jgi:hypothetical protein
VDRLKLEENAAGNPLNQHGIHSLAPALQGIRLPRVVSVFLHYSTAQQVLFRKRFSVFVTHV